MDTGLVQLHRQIGQDGPPFDDVSRTEDDGLGAGAGAAALLGPAAFNSAILLSKLIVSKSSLELDLAPLLAVARLPAAAVLPRALPVTVWEPPLIGGPIGLHKSTTLLAISRTVWARRRTLSSSASAFRRLDILPVAPRPLRVAGGGDVVSSSVVFSVTTESSSSTTTTSGGALNKIPIFCLQKATWLFPRSFVTHSISMSVSNDSVSRSIAAISLRKSCDILAAGYL